MHDLWNFSPPPAMSSSSEDEDSDEEGDQSKKKTTTALDQTGSAQVVDLNTPESAAKKGGNASASERQKQQHIPSALDLDLDLSPTKNAKRKAKPKAKPASEKSLKLQKILSANALKMASLRSEHLEDVDEFIKRAHDSAAREEDRVRSQLDAAASISSDDEDLLFTTTATADLTCGNSEDGAGGEKLVVVVALADGKKFELRLGKSDKMSKIIAKMSEILPKGQDFVLMFDGEKVSPETTPESLDMDDRDTIDCHLKGKIFPMGNVSSAGGEKLVVVVALADGKKHEYRLGKADKMEKVFAKLRETLPKNQDFVLMFDGEKVSPDTTPESLDMDDRDTIDCHLKK